MEACRSIRCRYQYTPCNFYVSTAANEVRCVSTKSTVLTEALFQLGETEEPLVKWGLVMG